MSAWTHIRGQIEVEPEGRTQHEMTYILNTVLDHLPSVTGSESDMHVSCSIYPGINWVKSHNEFLEPLRYRSYSARKKLEKSQTYYILTLCGDLRDREFDETLKEFNKWICRLAKRINVTDLLVRVEGGGKSIIIDNYKPYMDMYEWELSWADYLMWEYAPGTWYPLKLHQKYFANKYVAGETKRRRE